MFVVSGKLPPGSIQHSQHSTPGELTIYGNAITRVLLAVENEGAAAGRCKRLYVGFSGRFELKLAATAGGGNPDCTVLLPLAKPPPSPSQTTPTKTQPINP